MTDEDGATTGDTWSIERATVTINTLTISGRQVTLDVFRQLKEAVLIKHDGSLAGSPWGLVNYHQKRCDKLQKHAHVVWQLDDQLRQDTIQPPRWEPYRSETCDALVFADGTLEGSPSTMRSGQPEDPVRPRRSAARTLLMLFQPPEEPEQPSPADPEQPARFYWSSPKWGDRDYRGGTSVLIFQLGGMDCIGRLRQNASGGPDMAAEHSAANRDSLFVQLMDEITAEKERRARHEARWAEILDLPQLFIVV